ncbi:MAG: iron transporter [Burkholderiaceae bacterium]
MASRVLAGFGGGYALVSLLTAVLARALPWDSASAALVATMPSFLIYAAVVMTVFHARSASRAWLWLACAAAPLALAWWLLSLGASS